MKLLQRNPDRALAVLSITTAALSIISLWFPWITLFKQRSMFSLFSTARELQSTLPDLEKVQPFAFAFYMFPFLVLAGIALLAAEKNKAGTVVLSIPVLCIGVTGILFCMKFGPQLGSLTSVAALVVATLGGVILLLNSRRRLNITS